MEPQQKRTHTFHGEAYALSGLINNPFKQDVPKQADLALADAGGYRSNWIGEFEVESIASFGQAWTQVVGSSESDEGPWNTMCSTTLENVNVLNVLTADRMVAQITTEHPKVGYVPKVSFVGTQFVNLKIGGRQVDPILDLDFCDLDGGEYPEKPIVHDNRFQMRVRAQYDNVLAAAANGKNGKVPDWIAKQHNWDATQKSLAAKKPEVRCSLVKEIRGEHPGLPYTTCIHVPHFGKIYLAEVTVTDDEYRLNLVRVELGCPVGGGIMLGAARVNGSTQP